MINRTLETCGESPNRHRIVNIPLEDLRFVAERPLAPKLIERHRTSLLFVRVRKVKNTLTLYPRRSWEFH